MAFTHVCFTCQNRPVTTDHLCKAGIDVLIPHPLSTQVGSKAIRVPSQRPLTSCRHLVLPEFVVDVLFSVHVSVSDRD